MLHEPIRRSRYFWTTAAECGRKASVLSQDSAFAIGRCSMQLG